MKFNVGDLIILSSEQNPYITAVQNCVIRIMEIKEDFSNQKEYITNVVFYTKKINECLYQYNAGHVWRIEEHFINQYFRLYDNCYLDDGRSCSHCFDIFCDKRK